MSKVLVRNTTVKNNTYFFAVPSWAWVWGYVHTGHCSQHSWSAILCKYMPHFSAMLSTSVWPAKLASFFSHSTSGVMVWRYHFHLYVWIVETNLNSSCDCKGARTLAVWVHPTRTWYTVSLCCLHVAISLTLTHSFHSHLLIRKSPCGLGNDL